MVEVGRLAVKTAGRDSGQFCLIVDQIDEVNVLIDGNVRRKKCNLKHLEFMDKILKIKEKASSEDVKKALEKEGISILKKGDKRDRKKRPTKIRKKSSTKEGKKEEKTTPEAKKEDASSKS
jgi:large subunit ribosomal protein L14e